MEEKVEGELPFVGDIVLRGSDDDFLQGRPLVETVQTHAAHRLFIGSFDAPPAHLLTAPVLPAVTDPEASCPRLFLV
ncbi:hypothetical protein SCA03_18560 [Streptomyces cacaoi]|uniref:Uncharacterized protein n=1 Tax=Streptomyces cacaoi TaxID=1898 RepID=A0A4Y3QVD0_STRCI|nr:hypothetical protein SCA03_18560 [Streptomyces cacaoi]